MLNLIDWLLTSLGKPLEHWRETHASRPSVRLIAALGTGALAAVVLSASWTLVDMIRQSALWPRETADVRNYGLLAAAVLAGLLGYWRLKVSDRQAQQVRDGQLTDRFSKAVEQLGSDQMAVRIGGIYALERIAHDSKRDHWQVMEVLTAFVRNYHQLNRPKQSIASKVTVSGETDEPREDDKSQREKAKFPADAQAALDVIGRRKWLSQETHPMNLSGSDLHDANLQNANLQNAMSTQDRAVTRVTLL